MAVTVQSTIDAKVNITDINEAFPVALVSAIVAISRQFGNSVDSYYINQHTIAPVNTLTLDLRALVDHFGNTVTFGRINGIVMNLTTSGASGQLIGMGPGSSNGWDSFVETYDASGKLKLYAPGFVSLVHNNETAWVVTAAK